MSTEIPCTVGSGDLWFSDMPTDIDHARVLCVGCPIQRQCLEGALKRQETCGVWGGELFLGGLPVPSPKRNGRPPKNAKVIEAQMQMQMRQRIDAVLTSSQ
jgi:WhiB family redox-sensing transcriptional regulator